MSRNLRWPDPRTKPPAGSVLDRDHPLAPLGGCWLFNEMAGIRCWNHARNAHGTLRNATSWQPTGVDFNGSTAGFTSDDINLNLSPAVTCVVKYRLNSSPGSFPVIFEWGTDYISSPPGFGLYYSGSSATPGLSGNSSWVVSNVSNLSTVGRWYTAALTCDFSRNSASEFTFYAAGIALSSGGAANTNTGWGTRRLNIGNRQSNSQPMACSVEFAYLFDRYLSADEVRWVTSEPYAMFCLRDRRSYSFGSGGGGTFKPYYPSRNRIIGGGQA